MKEIILEASELPAEERALIVDSLLRTLNPPDPEIDRAWIEKAQNRLSELRSGKVEPVPGEDVFKKVKKIFEP